MKRAAALSFVLLLASGCGGSGDGDESASTTAAETSTTVALSRPFEVAESTRTYTNNARTLVTTVLVPDGDGPFPLVVFAHGNGGHARKTTMLLDAWTRAGYVVAAPAFPLTNDDVHPRVIGDYVEQPADITAVIDNVLADSEAASGPLAGAVDADRVGVAGHSLGGGSMYGLVADTCCRDDRVDAVIALSALRLPFRDGRAVPSDLPLLVVHGTADTSVPYDSGRAAFDAWAGPKWFLTLFGAPHSAAYEDPPTAWDAIVEEATTLFWDGELRGDSDAADGLAGYEPAPELARIE
ncbi:MAG: alpha/beta hydrolase family protein [Acidimicrobiia bacterium]